MCENEISSASVSSAVHRLGKSEIKYRNTIIYNRVNSDTTVKKLLFFSRSEIASPWARNFWILVVGGGIIIIISSSSSSGNSSSSISSSNSGSSSSSSSKSWHK